MGNNTVNVGGNVSNTMVVSGDNNKVAGGTMSDDSINISNVQGDVAFAKDQAIVTIDKGIKQSDASDAMKANLEKLSKAVKAMIKQMPDDKAKDILKDLETLSDEAVKKEPRKKWYELSCEGLIEAAKSVGEIGKPVIETTKLVLGLLG